ncbi:MAG: efflux RND transporter periplasmic adaptor subunit [Gammaproteobacteria bacterium]
MSRARKFKRWPIVAAVAAAIVGLIAWRVQAVLVPSHHARGYAALPVDAVRVTRQSVPLAIHAAGTVQTFHSVAVLAQVGGTLDKVLFNEGDQVKAGEPLFVVDPRTYQAQVDQARGQVEQDEAKLASDRANDERMANMIKQGYVSAQDYQNQQALVAQDEGLVASDKAKLVQAQVQLDYTHISAPISGKTGALAFKAGNLVQASGTTPLVTINQIEPILVTFNIPQSDIVLLQQYRNNPALDVSINSATGQTVASNGKLIFVDNSVNQNAGTLMLKAQFANQKHQLWPGELVHVGVQFAIESNQIALPTAAVQPGQGSDYVFVVQNGGAVVRNVTVARQYGGYSIISAGLNPGDVVVVNIPQQLHEGLAVRPTLLPTVAVVPASGSAGGGTRGDPVAPDPHS